jgi:flagellar hook-associated protein FlgK
VLLSRAEALVSQLHAYGSQINELNNQVNTQLESEADHLRPRASIATLNEQITATTANGNNRPMTCWIDAIT